MAGPAPFSIGLRPPSWRRRWALLVILEAAELTLAFLVPRLAGLAVPAFLMPFTACQLLSDSSLGQRLLFRWARPGGSARGPPLQVERKGAVVPESGPPRAIGRRLRTSAHARRGGTHLPARGQGR